ncbi:hypothetical protein D5086_018792 [Populus alba]|uniref:Uncharacterized protein n=1 Tax=Populus alba TaxID=43335 RepID=A0ACC4BS26_POPAL
MENPFSQTPRAKPEEKPRMQPQFSDPTLTTAQNQNQPEPDETSQRQNTANQTRAKENPKERVRTSLTQAQQQLAGQSKPREGNGIPS